MAQESQQAKAGRLGGLKTKRRHGKAYYSKLARMSHPKNNPKAQRKGAYNGGRPKKDD